MTTADTSQYRALIQKYFPPDQWDNAYRVMMAESVGGDPNAHATQGEDSRGLFQINVAPNANPELAGADLYDPETNVRIAARMYSQRGWQPWTTAQQMGLAGTTAASGTQTRYNPATDQQETYGTSQAGYSAPSATGGGSTMDTSNQEQYNNQAYAMTLQAAQAAAQQAYLNKKLELIDIPMSEAQRELLARQAAQTAAETEMTRSQMTGYYTEPGTSTPAMSTDQALDAIWAKRPDLAGFYQQNGWDVSTPEKQRAAVQNWLQMSDQGVVTSAGRDPLQVAQGLGVQGVYTTTPGATKATFPREQWETATTGMYNGSPTFANQQWQTGETGYMPGQNGQQGQSTLTRQQMELAATGYYGGAPTLAREQMEGNMGLQALQQQAALSGPRNAFQQMRLNAGLNQQGYSRYVDAIAGKYSTPGYQAPQEVPQRVSFQTMADDLRGAGQGQAGATGGYAEQQGASNPQLAAQQAAYQAYQNAQLGRTGTTTGYYPTQQGYTPSTTYLQQAQRDLANLPAPNKIHGNFFQLPQSAQDYAMSGYKELGYDPNDVLTQARRASLPGFSAPKFGTFR